MFCGRSGPTSSTTMRSTRSGMQAREYLHDAAARGVAEQRQPAQPQRGDERLEIADVVLHEIRAFGTPRRSRRARACRGRSRDGRARMPARCGRRCARAGRSRGAGSSAASPGRPIRGSGGAGRSPSPPDRAPAGACAAAIEARPRAATTIVSRRIAPLCMIARANDLRRSQGSKRSKKSKKSKRSERSRKFGPADPLDLSDPLDLVDLIGESVEPWVQTYTPIGGRSACPPSRPPSRSWCCSSCSACCGRPPGWRRRRRWPRRWSSRSPSTACR